ncbi:MAG: DUF4142 domain-containing protein [Bacteriovoracia bacterium]
MKVSEAILCVLAFWCIGASASLANDYASDSLTDPQIAQVVIHLNRGEIEMANYAKSKSTNLAVRGFADKMIREHGSARDKTLAFVAKHGMESESSTVGEQLKSSAGAAEVKLKQAPPDDFDRVYVDTQIQAHQEALKTIDEKLIPTVKSAELRKLLTEIRPKVAAHLDHAKDLKRKL